MEMTQTGQKGISMSFFLVKSNPLAQKDPYLGEDLIIIITHFKARKTQKNGSKNQSAQISRSESSAQLGTNLDSRTLQPNLTKQMNCK